MPVAVHIQNVEFPSLCIVLCHYLLMGESWPVATSHCSALLCLILIKSLYKRPLVHQTLPAPHFSDAWFPNLRLIWEIVVPLHLFFSNSWFRNLGGGGCTGHIREDKGGGSVLNGHKIKRIQIPRCLYPLVRRQSSEFKVEPLQVILKSLLKAIPENNRRFWLQNHLSQRPTWAGQTGKHNNIVFPSLLQSLWAMTFSLEENVLPQYHSCYTDSVLLSKGLMLCKFRAA